jgi:hypothetical protein
MKVTLRPRWLICLPTALMDVAHDGATRLLPIVASCLAIRSMTRRANSTTTESSFAFLLLPARGRHDAIHPQVLDHLAVVIL